MIARLSRHWPLLLVLAVSLLACANIWRGPGLVNTRAGGDSPFLLQRVFELVADLRAGAFPARWMPDAAYGLGYPFFHFYAALPYYLAAGASVLGFDLLTAIKLTQTFGMLAAAGAMYGYARSHLPRAGAALAAVAYALAPYHLVNVYVRGDSLQEFFAFAWFPLILWGIDRCVAPRPVFSGAAPQPVLSRPAFAQPAVPVALLALAVGGLVVTHNVSALIFAPFIVLYALAALGVQAAGRRWRQAAGGLGRLALAAVLAVALSAWFWLPALGDAPLVQLGDQTSGYFNYANHFRGADLVQPGWMFDYSVRDAGSPFAMGLAQAALALGGGLAWLAAAWRNRRQPAGGAMALLTVAVLCLVATGMITPLSRLLWERLPLLALAQFPWRFLSVQAVFTSLLTGGLALAAGAATQPAPGRFAAGVWIALPVGVILAQALPGLPNDRLDIRAEDVTPRSLQRYEWFTGNIGTTIRAEYLPATVQPRPSVGPDVLGIPRHAWVVAGEVLSSTQETAEAARQVWRIAAGGRGATVTLPLLYWPAWRARLIDRPAGQPPMALPLSAYAGSGWTMLSLPPGEHRIELWLDATPLQRAGEWVTIAGCLALAAAAAAAAVRRPPQPHFRRVARSTAGAAAAVGLGVLALVALAQLIRWLDPPQPPALQTMDYVERPFAHRAPLDFVDAAGRRFTLTAASVAPPVVDGGQVFTLTTAWQDGRAPAAVGLEQELPSGGYFTFLFRYARETAFGDAQLSLHRALTDTLPGPLVLKLRARDAAGQPLTPTVASTYQQGGPILAGLQVERSRASLPDQLIRVFPNGMALHHLDWIHTSANDLCLRLVWSTRRPQPDALKVALRLYGSDGREVAVADGEPQAGLAPTWSWPVGAPVGDNYCVPATGPLAPGEPYTLLVRLYRALDGRIEGEIRLAGVRGAQLFDLHAPQLALTQHRYADPPAAHLSQVVYGGAGSDIRLRGFEVITAGRALSLTLYWQAPARVGQDYKMFVHLSPLDRPEPAQQVDRLTLDGYYPTGVWQPGEIVTDTVAFNLDSLPAGRYRLAVGWYDPNTLARLPAQDAGRPVADGWVVLAEVSR